MDKFVQQKPKNKKQLAAKPKTDKKKRKSDGNNAYYDLQHNIFYGLLFLFS